eukprot:scaffold51613_cov32-Phaeocystis_antarctica.AAC.1
MESKGFSINFKRKKKGIVPPVGPGEGVCDARPRGLAKRQDAAGVRLLTACCTWPMRTRRPEGAARTASDGPHPAAPADVQLRLLAFGTVDGRLEVQSQVQLCWSSAGPRRRLKSHVLA